MRKPEKAIKKLAGIKPKYGEKLKPAKKRRAIGPSVGIAYRSSSGTQTRSGDAVSEEITNDPVAEEQADDAGGGGSNSAGGSGSGGGTTGDVDDLFKEDGSAAYGDQVATLTGLDPIDGGATSFDLNRPCGAEYDAPAGWDDPDTGPYPETYEPGKYWSSNDNYESYARHTVDEACMVTLGEYTYVGYYQDPNYPNKMNCVRNVWNGTPGGVNQTYSQVMQFECGSKDYDVCLTPAAREDEHPSDGECKIAYDCSEGGYKGHSMDPDCTAEQKTAKGVRYFTSASDPTKHYRVQRLANGGTKITPVDEPVYDGSGNLTSGGVPTAGGISVTTDASGRVNGYYDSSSQVWVK